MRSHPLVCEASLRSHPLVHEAPLELRTPDAGNFAKNGRKFVGTQQVLEAVTQAPDELGAHEGARGGLAEFLLQGAERFMKQHCSHPLDFTQLMRACRPQSGIRWKMVLAM